MLVTLIVVALAFVVLDIFVLQPLAKKVHRYFVIREYRKLGPEISELEYQSRRNRALKLSLYGLVGEVVIIVLCVIGLIINNKVLYLNPLVSNWIVSALIIGVCIRITPFGIYGAISDYYRDNLKVAYYHDLNMTSAILLHPPEGVQAEPIKIVPKNL